MPYTVEAVGLRKAYGSHVVLDGVDLAVSEGDVFALLGPNGAGKSTMVRVLSTLVRPDAGRATVAGHDLATEPGAVRAAIAVTGQGVSLDEVLTAEENLVMMGRLLRLGKHGARARAAELVDQFGLGPHRAERLGVLSGGTRRRVDLAASLIARPRVLFLDEPTTGLDPRSRETVWAAVRDLAAGGTTVFLTTQYLDEADRLAGHVALLDGGRIVAEGSPQDLKRSVADGATLDDVFFALTEREREPAVIS